MFIHMTYLNLEQVKCATRKVHIFEHFVLMVEPKKFSYLYLGKLSKLANPTKMNFRKPKLLRYKS